MQDPTTLEAALDELYKLREFAMAVEQTEKAELADYCATLEDENERMRAAFKQFLEASQDGKSQSFNFSASGCEWCGEMWPKCEGQSVEQTHAAARLHLRRCEKHPVVRELEVVRDRNHWLALSLAKLVRYLLKHGGYMSAGNQAALREAKALLSESAVEDGQEGGG